MSKKLNILGIVAAIIAIATISIMSACGAFPHEETSEAEAEARLKVLEIEREKEYATVSRETGATEYITETIDNSTDITIDDTTEGEINEYTAEYFPEYVADDSYIYSGFDSVDTDSIDYQDDTGSYTGQHTEEETLDTDEEIDVYQLAYDLYGLDEYDVTGCLKIISYEGYGYFDEWTLSYYCACACISCALDGDVYREFGRADTSYTASNFAGVSIADWAYASLREALGNHTYVYEINGIRYDFENAIYDSWCNGTHFGVWQY